MHKVYMRRLGQLYLREAAGIFIQTKYVHKLWNEV